MDIEKLLKMLKDMSIGFLLGVTFIVTITLFKGHQWNSEIVKHGFAEYSSTTGDWQWKDSIKCEEGR